MLTVVLILIILILFAVLGLCFEIIGDLLKIVLKVVICVPCALVLAVAGLVFCCTLILIPVGIGCFKLAGKLLNPFKLCTV